MHDELTKVDIQKMQEEIDYRTHEQRPKIIEDVKTARAFGDLSENYEYKAAKQELRRCDSRIRFLKRMIASAKVIDATSKDDEVGLFDKVELFYEEDNESEVIELTTTLRRDVFHQCISKESPLGQTIMGHKVGDRVLVKASDTVPRKRTGRRKPADSPVLRFLAGKTPLLPKTLIRINFLSICAPVVTRFVTRYASEGHTSGLTRAPVRVARRLTGR